MQPLPLSYFRMFSSPPKETSYLLSIHSIFFPLPPSPAATSVWQLVIYFCLYGFYIVDILYKCDQVIRGLRAFFHLA